MVGITDIHCHIVPGVDDGAETWSVTKKILDKEYCDGVRRIIWTPHYRKEYFETSMDKILSQYRKLKMFIRAAEIDIQVELGCEYHCHSEMTQALLNKERPTMAGSNYVLVEFSSAHSYRAIRNQIFELCQNDFLPIMAHVERYTCILENWKYIDELRQLGANIQVNAGSVLGRSGRTAKRFCGKLMEENLLDFIASDTHNMDSRKPNLGRCAAYVEKKMGRGYARRIFMNNPKKIRAEKGEK